MFERSVPVLGGVAMVASAAILPCCGGGEPAGVAAPEPSVGVPARTDPEAADPGAAAPGAPSSDASFDFDGGSSPPGPKVRTIWAIDDANALVRFPAKEPQTVTTIPVTGVAQGEKILGVDFRASNGRLYALGSTSRIYTLDPATGAASPVGAQPFSPPLAGQAFGFDFNPVADAIRVHSDVDQNLRINANTGAVAAVDGALAFTEGDVNFGQSPNLVATAYTNSVSPKPATTTLYAIDSTRDLLTRVAPPNDGKVATVGPLGVDVASVAGFDVFGGTGGDAGVDLDGGSNLEAYAALVATGEQAAKLYTIDLATGSASVVGAIAHGRPLTGIAVEP